MRKVLKIDKEGFFVEDVIIADGEEIPTDCIAVTCPGGFFKPKWDGAEWIEGLTQAEIDEINRQPIIPTTEERLAALEELMMGVI